MRIIKKNENTRSTLRPEAAKSLGKKSDVLVLTILNDFQSFGTKRTIHDYIELLKKFEYDPKKISVGMLITDIHTYEVVEGSGERNLRPLQRGQGISSRIRRGFKP